MDILERVKKYKIKTVDPIVHAPVRLTILTVLISSKTTDLSCLHQVTETSHGNLGSHIQKLEKADYIDVKKTFVGKKPRTILSITKLGRKAYKDYVQSIKNHLKYCNHEY